MARISSPGLCDAGLTSLPRLPRKVASIQSLAEHRLEDGLAADIQRLLVIPM